MHRLLLLSAILALSCAGKAKDTRPEKKVDPCNPPRPMLPFFQAQYDEDKDQTVVRVGSKGVFCAPDTAVVAAAGFAGRKPTIAPRLVMVGLGSRAKKFRLANCPAITIRGAGRVPLRFFVKRHPQIGKGLLHELLYGAMTLVQFRNFVATRELSFHGCGIVHHVTAAEYRVLREMLVALRDD